MLITKTRRIKKVSIVNNRPGLQAGLSLIELMVAMFIGLFLLLSISSVYLSNVKTSTTRDQFSLLEDNARIALDTMKNVIEHTRYSGPKNVLLNASTGFMITATTNVNNNAACAMGNALFTAARRTQDNANGDSIGVIYHGYTGIDVPPNPGPTRDCSGSPAMPAVCQLTNPPTPVNSVSSQIYSAFYLTRDIANNKYELKCVGSLERNNQPQVIAEGVENMQITYGLDTNGDSVADRYVNATSVANRWPGIVSVQIAVLVKSEKPVKDQKEQITYDLLGSAYPAPNDKYQRAVFSTTVFLRNS